MFLINECCSIDCRVCDCDQIVIEHRMSIVTIILTRDLCATFCSFLPGEVPDTMLLSKLAPLHLRTFVNSHFLGPHALYSAR